MIWENYIEKLTNMDIQNSSTLTWNKKYNFKQGFKDVYLIQYIVLITYQVACQQQHGNTKTVTLALYNISKCKYMDIV